MKNLNESERALSAIYGGSRGRSYTAGLPSELFVTEDPKLIMDAELRVVDDIYNTIAHLGALADRLVSLRQAVRAPYTKDGAERKKTPDHGCREQGRLRKMEEAARAAKSAAHRALQQGQFDEQWRR